MRVHHASAVAGILRRHLLHMTLAAGGGFGRIIKRPRALAGHAAGLPVIVLVETAEPTVIVYRLVQVNFVAGRTELRRVLAHEGLHEGAAVRLGVEIGDELVGLLDPRIPARSEIMQRRISDDESSVSRRSIDVHDRVAGNAPQAVLRLRRVHLFLNGALEAAVEEHCMIVTSGAPLAPLRSAQLLHLFDGTPVELVVERRKVMHGALPLLVDVLVTFAAQGGVHEEVGGDHFGRVGVRRGRPERRLRPSAFPRHGERDRLRISYAAGGQTET